MRAEGVADLGPVERDADGARVDGTVIGDVGEVEAVDGAPGRIEISETMSRFWQARAPTRALA